LPPDATRVAAVYDRVCAACHQADGLGKRWGAPADAAATSSRRFGTDSFSDGAGMDHFQRAVGFIQHDMPRGTDPAIRSSPCRKLGRRALLQSKPRRITSRRGNIRRRFAADLPVLGKRPMPMSQGFRHFLPLWPPPFFKPLNSLELLLSPYRIGSPDSHDRLLCRRARAQCAGQIFATSPICRASRRLANSTT